MWQVLQLVSLPSEWCADPVPTETNALPGAIYAVPFGQMTSTALLSFADAVGSDDIALTPWRQFVVADAQTVHEIQGFVTDLTAPLLRAQACTGAPRCLQAMGETHALAVRLSQYNDMDLHVSGCPKGCAKRTKTPVTVVHGANGLDLIINGCTWDQPDFSGLDEGQLVQKIREIDATHL
jgi:precorrin-3B synthase